VYALGQSRELSTKTEAEMGRKLGVWLLLLSFVFGAPAFAVEVGVDDKIGAVIMNQDGEANGTNRSTNWSAFYNKTTVFVDHFEKEGPAGEIWFGMPVTSTSRRDYKEDGDVFAKVDTMFWGFDTGVDVGWTFAVDTKGLFGEHMIYMTPLVGYSFRFYRFSQSDSDSGDSSTTDYDYYLNFVDVGGRVSTNISEKTELFFKPMFGIGVHSVYDNEDSGSITANGDSWFANLDLGVNYKITENFIFGISVNYDYLGLDGGQKGDFLFLDGSMHTIGGKVALTYKF